MSCPLGYICTDDLSKKVTCRHIQEKARVQFSIGDVYAGIYCPEGENVIKNCDEGHYCPDPATKLKCPSKYYCPHKTDIYSISCSACKEGSTSYERPLWGYFVVIAFIVLVLLFMMYSWKKKQDLHVRNKLMDLGNRVLGEDEQKRIQEKYQKRLERLEPLLEAMERKLGDDDILITNEKGVRIFDAERLYTELDVDKSGDLSYEELNNVLDLRPRQLEEFMTYMNKLGGESEGEETVLKETFVHHFIEALDQASNFDPSGEEAERVYAQLLKELNVPETQGIDLYKLQETHLSSFLSESEIIKLRKKFQKQSKGTDAVEDFESNFAFRSKRSFRNLNVTTVMVVKKEFFVEFYPTFLAEIKDGRLIEEISSSDMIDLTFQNLSLHVTVKDQQKAVVNNVTGRIHQKSMTALLGGSGAGKTSLLNALCGRAFYGEVSGDIYINGQKASIDDHKSAVGFVPQDDIVYAELTVKENFMFAGKFQLPSSTSTEEIEQLAESTMASLGLTRVANSIVGDVHIRGVSGGEKKRVNIGLELMARPRILFLDEPTSGLDASSAMLVMKSLKGLVTNNAMTIVAVIHQPRKTIVELFDSIILLGIGGKMVYHGPVNKVEDYFSNLRYYLPAGENVADWLIDISSGSVEPEVELSNPSDHFGKMNRKRTQHRIQRTGREMDWMTKMKLNREKLYLEWDTYVKSNNDAKSMLEPPEQYDLPPTRTRTGFFRQLSINLKRNLIVMVRQKNTKLINLFILLGVCIIMSLLDGTAKLTEEKHPSINYEFDYLTTGDISKFLKTMPAAFKYAASSSKMTSYAMKVGVISSVLLGLSAAKNFNDKRVEFFREAGSGYNVNAFFLSVHMTTLLEQLIMIIITAIVALWLRNSFTNGFAFIVNFIMMDWVVVAWGLLFPLFIPPENVIVVTGCFMAYCGIQFSGQLAPVNFKDMYKNKALLAIASIISPVRFFVEQMAVSEQRALPAQSGFTQKYDSYSVNFPKNLNAFNLIGSAQLDIDTVKSQSTGGWYWPILRAFMIGLSLRLLSFGFIHMFNRERQYKKSLMEELKGPEGSKKVLLPLVYGTGIVLGVFGFTVYLFVN